MKKSLGAFMGGVAAAMVCWVASPGEAMASEGSVAATQEAAAYERLGIGFDYRLRHSLFDDQTDVVRVSIEYALIEPSAGDGGLRLDVFSGVGSTVIEDYHQRTGVYLDAGLRLGWEWNVWEEGAIALAYDISLSKENGVVSHTYLMGSMVSAVDPTTLHNRVGVEVGVQQGLRLRLGLGMSIASGERSVWSSSQDQSDQVYFFGADAGVIWRM